MICEARARRVARGVMGNSAIGGAGIPRARPPPLSSPPYHVTRSSADQKFPAPILLHENKNNPQERSEGRKASGFGKG